MHFFRVFEFNPREITLEEENKLLSEPVKMDVSARPFTVKKVRAAIRELNPKKAPDC